MAEHEAIGLSGKQAYTVAQDSPAVAYKRVDVRTMLSTQAGEDVVNDVQKVETRGASINILTATTTVVKAAPGHLNGLYAVGGTMGSVTVYDNTVASGTILFGPATPTAGGIVMANVSFSIGLTVVTAAATCLSGSWR